MKKLLTLLSLCIPLIVKGQTTICISGTCITVYPISYFTNVTALPNEARILFGWPSLGTNGTITATNFAYWVGTNSITVSTLATNSAFLNSLSNYITTNSLSGANNYQQSSVVTAQTVVTLDFSAFHSFDIYLTNAAASGTLIRFTNAPLSLSSNQAINATICIRNPTISNFSFSFPPTNANWNWVSPLNLNNSQAATAPTNLFAGRLCTISLFITPSNYVANQN